MIRIVLSRCKKAVYRPTFAYLAFIVLPAACILYAPGMAAHLPGLDESGYLHRGALLVERHQIHPLAHNPAPTLVNGAIYSLLFDKRIQLEDVSTVRRWLTFLMIVAGTYYAALNCLMSARVSAITAVMVGTSPSLRLVLNNSSDALYAAFLIFSFGWAARELREIARRSPSAPVQYAMVGFLLSALALSRNDGVIVAPLIIMLLALLLKWRRLPIAAILSRLGMAVAIFCVPLGTWCVLHGLQAHDWNTRIPERSYIAFCQGQNILYLGQFIDSPNAATAESIFGSADQNHGNFLRAIAGRPGAFLQRLRRIPSNAMQSCIVAVGGKAEFIFVLAFLFAGVGWLLVERKVPSLLLFAVCLSPLALYPLTFFRGGYFAMNFPVVCVASMSGIAFFLRRNGHGNQRNIQIIGACLACWLVLNCVQVLLWEHASLAAPQLLNDTNRRDWIAKLQNSILKDTHVISVDPSLLWYAHLESNHDSGLFLRVHSKTELTAYMREHRLEYVAVDADMRRYFPHFAALVESAKLEPVIEDSAINATVFRLGAE